jgi:putative ABC transport system permease protein
MDVISLTPLDLAVAGGLVVAVALISLPMRLGLSGQLLVAGLRTALQLTLVGFVLEALFQNVHPAWMALMALAMVAIAGIEVANRQKRGLAGWWGFGIGAFAMLVTSFSITLLALTAIIGVAPWYEPQYAIPLLGLMLGNTMSGVAIGMERLTESAWEQREVIEARLMLGHPWSRAVEAVRRNAARSGMIPIINTMSVVGLVKLPGMMTGQILAGALPLDAVKYQILIMFLVAAGTGFGTICAVWLGARRLFDDRQRLRVDRLGGQSA